MNWLEFNTPAQLEKIKEESYQQPVLIFKHSTRCSISQAVLNRIERNWNTVAVAELKPYYLDLISYRPVSNLVAEDLNVEHQSPQAIILNKGKVIYSESHLGIDLHNIQDVLQAQANIKN